MSRTDDIELIDRHLAGVLSPEDEARLEHLIRTSPEWAQRYREAEEMAALLGQALGPTEAPQRVKRAVHAGRRADARVVRVPGIRRASDRSRRWLAVAAVFVALIGAYLFFPEVFPGPDDEIVPHVHAEPMPLKDLARSSHVAVIGWVVDHEGQIGLRVEETLYGSADRGIVIPDTLRPGQHVALFGVLDGSGVVRVVGDDQGVVHLDGPQMWEGSALAPDQTRERLDRVNRLRSLASCLDDLVAFLASDGTRVHRDVDGLSDRAAITATYLGRFPAEHTREPLLELVVNADKHPDARNAGGAALVAAAPFDACRRLLDLVLGGAKLLRAESEDGFVVLTCLRLMQMHGGPELADDLKSLASQLGCPALRGTAEDAERAVRDAGSRRPRRLPVIEPLRLVQDGHEGLVLSGCEGRKDGLVVFFREAQSITHLRVAINVAVGAGLGVVVLPDGDRDVARWIDAAVETGHVAARNVRYMGFGPASARAALEAARRAQGVRAVLLARGLDSGAKDENFGLRVHLVGPDLEQEGPVGSWLLESLEGDSREWVRDPALLRRVLTTD